MLRLIRLTRLVKLFRAMPELMTLLRAFSSAARSCLCTIFLLLVLIYVYAIAFRQFVDEDTEIGKALFADVIRSMYTLLRDGLLPDYAPLIREVEPAGWLPTTVIIGFVILATFALLNMLVGILCDVAIRVSKMSRDELNYQRVRTSLQDIILTRIDKNYDGQISKEEFLGIMQDEKASSVVRSIGVDVAGLTEEADVIYDAVDDDGTEYERTLSFHQFMETLVGMTPENEVTLKDLNALRLFVDRRAKDVERRMNQQRPTATPKQRSSRLGDKLSRRTNSDEADALPGGASQADAQRQALQSPQLPEVAQEAPMAMRREVDEIRQQLLGLRDVATQLMRGQAELSGNVQDLHGQIMSFLEQATAGGKALLLEPSSAVVSDGSTLNYSEGARSVKPLPFHPGDEPENDDEKLVPNRL